MRTSLAGTSDRFLLGSDPILTDAFHSLAYEDFVYSNLQTKLSPSFSHNHGSEKWLYLKR